MSDEFHERLVEAVRICGKTNGAIAREMRMDPAQVRKVFREKARFASRNLVKFADATDTSVDYLLCRTDNPSAHKTAAGTDPINPHVVRLGEWMIRLTPDVRGLVYLIGTGIPETLGSKTVEQFLTGFYDMDVDKTPAAGKRRKRTKKANLRETE